MKYEKKSISDILRSNNTVFTFRDISIIWGDTDRKAVISGINYYVKTGALYRIRRGIYAKDKNYNKSELAVKIFSPSYISFETVLAKAGIIFQFYGQIFIASYLTREITADGQVYSYKKIKDSILTNHAGIKHEKNLTIASPERAFLDVVYLNKDYHFDNLSNLNWDKVFEILPVYGNKRMQNKVKRYFEEDKKDTNGA
jgi:predicted transcriptional regulator of viral defense system